MKIILILPALVAVALGDTVPPGVDVTNKPEANPPASLTEASNHQEEQDKKEEDYFFEESETGAFNASAMTIQENGLIRGPYPRFIKFPDGDGNLQSVDLDAKPDLELLDEIARNPAKNLYLLFTKRNPKEAQTLVFTDPQSINLSNFNPDVPTIVIVHGWLSNQHTKINRKIRDAYLGSSASDVNVIVLDWKRLAHAEYATAVIGVPNIGRGLGQFLKFLNNVTGASYKNMHLIGFSLGAHVVGNAGREIGERELARITGLDPAGPLWHHNSKRLKDNDAFYVEIIHTNAGRYGIGIAIGVADYFANNGKSQPGCINNVANHNRAWDLFAASVEFNHLIGKKCDTNKEIKMNHCHGHTSPMGNDDLKKFETGLFRANTDSKWPF